MSIGAALSVSAGAFLGWMASTYRTSTGMWTFESPAFGALIFIGIVQILWMLPAVLTLVLMKRFQTMKGVLIVAGIVFLLDFLLMLLPMMLFAAKS
jgi:hypothetical protein